MSMMGSRRARRRLRDRTWFFPAVMAAVAAGSVAGAAANASPGLAGIGLMSAVAAAAPAGRRLVRGRDGSRLHGAVTLVAGVLLMTAAALVLADSPMFLDDRGRYGAGVVFFTAPFCLLFGGRLCWIGVRLTVAPQPNWFRDRRRARPYRLALCAPAETGGWRLEPPSARLDGFLLPADEVISVQPVGPERKGAVMVRAALVAGALGRAQAPAWVHALMVDSDALEFPVAVDVAAGLV